MKCWKVNKMVFNPIPTLWCDVHQLSMYLISLLGRGYLSTGKVPNSCFQTGADRHPRARTVFLQSPYAGLLLFGQGRCWGDKYCKHEFNHMWSATSDTLHILWSKTPPLKVGFAKIQKALPKNIFMHYNWGNRTYHSCRGGVKRLLAFSTGSKV